MTTIALVLALASFAGLVLLAFGYASLLTLVRNLQDGLEASITQDARRPVERFAGDRRSFVLVIEPTCLSCEDRISDLVEYVKGGSDRAPLSFAVLQAANGSRPQALPHDVDVEFVSDATLVGRLGVGIVPLGLVFDTSGNEVGRSVLGDRLSFERMIAWASAQDQIDVRTAQVGG